MKSTIKLFKAVPITAKRKKNPSKELLEETIKKGFIFSPEVVANCSNIMELIKIVEEEIGLTPEKFNSSFHKSWGKVKDAPIEKLVAEQIIHYFTTYGFEELGIYDESSVYIPNEQLDIPEIEKDIKLTIIRGYTKEELKVKLLSLLSSGIALKEDTIKDVIDVAMFVELKEEDIETIKNKEVRIIMYDKLDLVPEKAVEFLRYLVYKTTGNTLLIKDNATIEKIKESELKFIIIDLFTKYQNKHGLEKLSEIFYRFKPIFLAFRTNSVVKPTINRIRKLAKKNHKPLHEDYLNSITSKIKKYETITRKELELELSKVNIFRKIRLSYALKYRTEGADSILYRIRNGKGYAKEFYFENRDGAKAILEIVLSSIVNDIKKNVKGKTVYIPKDINYTLPATEKQFTGYFPSGSYITIPKDMIVGIHWENVDNHRIDLDLSLINITEGKIGWDSSYRTDDRNVLFSGDLTTAPKPNGASELFYVQKHSTNAYIMIVNYYNYDKDVNVPFKIITAKEQVSNYRDFRDNYMINPNNILSVAKTEIKDKQKILGLLLPEADNCRFYFAETSIGKTITSSDSDFMEHSRKYLLSFYKNTINLKDILGKAGAKFVETPDKVDIDLSPENLEKDTILNLLKRDENDKV